MGKLYSYSVTLDTEIVLEAKGKIESSGGKLSPILNRLLKAWVLERETMEETVKDIFETKSEEGKK